MAEDGAEAGDDLEDLGGEHGEDARVVFQDIQRHRVLHAGEADEGDGEDGGDEALEEVEKEAGDAVFFPDDAEDVGGADVA